MVPNVYASFCAKWTCILIKYCHKVCPFHNEYSCNVVHYCFEKWTLIYWVLFKGNFDRTQQTKIANFAQYIIQSGSECWPNCPEYCWYSEGACCWQSLGQLSLSFWSYYGQRWAQLVVYINHYLHQMTLIICCWYDAELSGKGGDNYLCPFEVIVAK